MGARRDEDGPRSYEFDPPDPEAPYDMDFADRLSRWILVGFVTFGLLAGALLRLRLPT